MQEFQLTWNLILCAIAFPVGGWYLKYLLKKDRQTTFATLMPQIKALDQANKVLLDKMEERQKSSDVNNKMLLDKMEVSDNVIKMQITEWRQQSKDMLADHHMVATNRHNILTTKIGDLQTCIVAIKATMGRKIDDVKFDATVNSIHEKIDKKVEMLHNEHFRHYHEKDTGNVVVVPGQ